MEEGRDANVLSIHALTVGARQSAGARPLVDSLSFELRAGEALGLMGGSGSGKSLTALALMRLLPWPYLEIQSGQILWQDKDLSLISDTELALLRGRHIALLLQDAATALHPMRNVEQQLFQVFSYHASSASQDKSREKIESLLKAHGLSAKILQAYPHELSGGMRQRVLWVMARLLDPEILIADEATHALDASVQADVIEQLRGYLEVRSRALLLISHDIGFLAELCDRIMVLCGGRLVEEASLADLLHRPLHPYTQALLAAAPLEGRKGQRLFRAQASLQQPGLGCAFASACLHADRRCEQEAPPLLRLADGRRVACHRSEESGA